MKIAIAITIFLAVGMSTATFAENYQDCFDRVASPDDRILSGTERATAPGDVSVHIQREQYAPVDRDAADTLRSCYSTRADRSDDEPSGIGAGIVELD